MPVRTWCDRKMGHGPRAAAVRSAAKVKPFALWELCW